MEELLDHDDGWLSGRPEFERTPGGGRNSRLRSSKLVAISPGVVLGLRSGFEIPRIAIGPAGYRINRDHARRVWPSYWSGPGLLYGHGDFRSEGQVFTFKTPGSSQPLTELTSVRQMAHGPNNISIASRRPVSDEQDRERTGGRPEGGAAERGREEWRQPCSRHGARRGLGSGIT